MKRRPAAGGFAMLEVLVALLLILIGLLGLLGLMTRANSAEVESYQRVQAMILLRDIQSRMEANRAVIACYSNAAAGLQLGTGYAGAPTCTLGTPAQSAQAVADMVGWNSLLLGSAENVAGNNVGAMIGARGCITQIDPINQVYAISIVWQGLVPTVSPTVACGQGLYGANDGLRRAITITLQIGTLT